MQILIILIPIALLLGILGLSAFIWSVITGQMDDLDGDGSRILMDEEDRPL